MAPHRNFVRTTATETGTDGALVRDLSTTAGATTLASQNVNDTGLDAATEYDYRVRARA
jgi:hypothetical protein